MSRLRVPPPANDEERTPLIRVEGLELPSLFVAEVEIFDTLISNIAEMAGANDNESPPKTEKRP